MNYKTTLFLLCLAILAGVSLLLTLGREKAIDPANPTPSDTANAEGRPLFSADAMPTSRVESITLAVGGKQYVFKLTNGEWFQTEPVRFPMDRWGLQQIIDEGAKLRYLQKLTPGRDAAPTLAEAELETSSVVITYGIGGDKPSQQVVMLGRSTVGGQAYTRVGGDESLYVTGDSLHRAIRDQKVETWRKRRFNGPSEGRAQRVTLIRGDETVDVIKEDGRWRLADGDRGRVNIASVISLLDKVTELYASNFVADSPPDLALYGLDKPWMTIQITGEPEPEPDLSALMGGEAKPPTPPATPSPSTEPRVLTFRIGAPIDLDKSGYFVMWDDGLGSPEDGVVVFTVSRTPVEHYIRSANAVRDPNIVLAGVPNVRELTIVPKGGTPVRLLRSAEGWTFGDPKPSFSPDGGEVTKILEAITNTTADSFISGDALAEALKTAGEPILTLTLSAVGQNTPETVRIYIVPEASGGEARLAVRDDEKVGQLLAVAKVDPLFITASGLRDRTLVELAEGDIARITLEQSDGVRHVFEQTVPGENEAPPAPGDPAAAEAAFRKRWKLIGHDTFEAAAFVPLLRQLSPLRVAAWLDTAQVAQIKPDVTVTIETFKGERHGLHIASQNAHAMLDGQSTPFTLTPGLVRLANSEMRDRTLMTINPQDVMAVEIGDLEVSGLNRHWIRVERNPDTRQFLPVDKTVPFNITAFTKLLDNVTGLRAIRWLDKLPDEPIGREIKITLADGTNVALGLSVTGVGRPVAVLASEGKAAIISPERFKFLIDSMLDKPIPPGGATDEEMSSFIPPPLPGFAPEKK